MVGIHLLPEIIVIILIIIGGLFYFSRLRRSLRAMRNAVDKTWADLDLLLKQRHDELPKLIGTCRGYIPQDHPAFQPASAARAAYMKAGAISEKARANALIENAIQNLLAAAEAHRDLKVNNSFTKIKKQLAEIDREIGERQRFFNDLASRYNRRIESGFLIRLMKLQPRQMFINSKEDANIAAAQLSDFKQPKG